MRREFLEMLSYADDDTISVAVQSVAKRLLRHFPLNIDLDVSASALPAIWAPPSAPPRHG
ncbi:BPSL0761 family protein [Paraburkholderia hospita]|uniref:BPSL0761 family protein n=1 Tax=Paraburkholderia hospita TaxID=169430 RepID=UPI002ADE0F34|nr:BPSL0761 family protein [Paraburkholderia hospita]